VVFARNAVTEGGNVMVPKKPDQCFKNL
jgi:hypothetical protein